MDGFLLSSSSSHSQETSLNSTTTRSGLTLVLPSLKNLKATKAAKKSKAPASVLTSSAFDGEVAERKAPRPVKLKPLKEVLTKLIQQIKKYVIIHRLGPWSHKYLFAGKMTMLFSLNPWIPARRQVILTPYDAQWILAP